MSADAPAAAAADRRRLGWLTMTLTGLAAVLVAAMGTIAMTYAARDPYQQQGERNDLLRDEIARIARWGTNSLSGDPPAHQEGPHAAHDEVRSSRGWPLRLMTLLAGIASEHRVVFAEVRTNSASLRLEGDAPGHAEIAGLVQALLQSPDIARAEVAGLDVRPGSTGDGAVHFRIDAALRKPLPAPRAPAGPPLARPTRDPI